MCIAAAAIEAQQSILRQKQKRLNKTKNLEERKERKQEVLKR